MKFYYYKITNIINNQFYIGITTNFEKRKHQHFQQLESRTHANYKMQKDYNEYGRDAFYMEVIDELEGTKEEGYQHEYELIQQTKAVNSYNIAEGGLINPVYSPQILSKLTQTHQEKYPNILQYKFIDNHFILVNTWQGIRDASRGTDCDFRAIQKSIKNGQQHHDYYWVQDGTQIEWMQTFLKRFKCCVAKINEETKEIEDSALTITEFAVKYNTTYERIYASLIQNNRCERKYKFIRISSEEFAKLNNLSL